MSTPAALGSRLWQGAGRVYEALPQRLVDVLGRAHPLLALAGGVRVPVAIARGHVAGTPATAAVLVAGEGPDVDWLLGLALDGPIEHEPLARISIAALPRLLRQRREECDLTLVRADGLSGRILHGDEYLRLPEWIGTRLAVPRDLEAHVRAVRSRYSDAKRMRANGLRWQVSHEAADFERFHREMYLPFARRRHGGLAVERSVHLLRRVFRSGCLLFVVQDERRLAAILLMESGAVLRFVVLGTAGGRLEPIRDGALSALYLFSLEYAGQRGLAAVDFGGVRPCLTDGVLWHKRKWGVHLAPKPDVYHDLLLYWPRRSPAVDALLAAHPLVCRHGRQLAGVAAALDGTPASVSRLHHRLATPGLQRLVVVDGRAPGGPASPGVICLPATAQLDSAAVAQAMARDGS